jgi:hypothetical protein
MTIEKAAEFFGVSKEAIHNRVRRGSLKSVIQNGVKFVMIEKNQTKTTNTNKNQAKDTDNPQEGKYYKFLEEQNTKLQNRVEVLESETRTLRDQKEQMLIQEREKIEQIYKDKDEQLKNILGVISSKFMLNAPLQTEQVEHLDAEIEVEEETKSSVISLKKHLKQLKISDKKTQKIKKRFKKSAKKDERIIIIGNKYYVDISKYDYSDLLESKSIK